LVYNAYKRGWGLDKATLGKGGKKGKNVAQNGKGKRGQN